jgi:cephalosporin hydroxylase
MPRAFLACACVFTVLTTSISAAEIRCEFVRYDEAHKVLTVDVKGKASDYTLSDETKVTTQNGAPTKHGIKTFCNSRVAKPGAVLTIVTAKHDGKDVVTEIKLGGRRE